MLRLENKVAIVTGGATGIGEAICKKFAAEGAKVLVNGMPGDPVYEVVAEIKRDGLEAAPFIADISIEENAKACIEAAVVLYGKLDILINNAGVFPVMDEIQNFSAHAFDFLVNHNMKTSFLMTRFAVPELKKTKGCIVAAGSEAGMQGLAENSVYGGTKGWIHAFIRGVAAEQAKYGIRANCVCPGVIDTAWSHKDMGQRKSRYEEQLVAATPLGRRGTAEEIANAYLFLASEEASFVTGALFSVDGGITISKGPAGEEAEPEVRKRPEGMLQLSHTMDGATSMLRGGPRTEDIRRP